MQRLKLQLERCTNFETDKIRSYTSEEAFWLYFKETGFIQAAALATSMVTDGKRSDSRKEHV